jgi:hypothetical protein
LSDPTGSSSGSALRQGNCGLLGPTHPLTTKEAVELGSVLTRVEEHPWLAQLSTRYLGRFSVEPVPITRVAPTSVVEVEADTAFEHGRWRHLTHYRRVRWDLCG